MLMAEAIPSGKRVTLGGDKNYDTQEFVRELRGMNITPHVAQKARAGSQDESAGGGALEAGSSMRPRAAVCLAPYAIVCMGRKI
jgi:hypothetical protein